VTRPDVPRRLAALYEGRGLQGYVRWKAAVDPAYGAVLEHLQSRSEPLIDVGCGIGLLAFYLREHGYGGPIVGVDFDQRKIDVARKAATRYRGIDFISGDARDPLPEGHNVVILDILQYFDAASQQKILANAAAAVPPGGIVILRQGIRDESWRHRFTLIVDTLARTLHWMKAEAERLTFPTREEVVAPFAGFDAEVRTLWGNMPYNNYLFVFRKRRDVL
jgi:2-polyprenyl-3-methyl-5-hydroxy-6-metoxy-1,4-benzoquinol methylase